MTQNAFNVNQEVETIMTEYNNHNLDLPILDKFNIDQKIRIIEKIIEKVNSGLVFSDGGEHKNFKMEYYYPLLEFVVDIINKLYLSPNITSVDVQKLDSILLKSLIEKLTKLYKGQNLLNKLNYHITKVVKKEDYINSMLIESSVSGTFITFLFWLNKTKSKKLDCLNASVLNDIYTSCIGNSDDRLFKFVMNHIVKNDKLFFQQKSSLITKMIETLALSIVPAKYKLKRIKILSQQISLVPFFNVMISNFKDEKVLIELHKYYYVLHYDFSSLRNLINNIITYNEIKDNNMINKLIGLLKTEEEKMMCQIISSLITYNDYDFKIKNIVNFENLVINNYTNIIRHIVWDYFVNSIELVNFNKILVKILIKNNLITKYCIENKKETIENKFFLNSQIFWFTRFLPVNTIPKENSFLNGIIRVNLLLHKLRLLARAKTKNRIIEHNVKMFDLLNEIKSFKPQKSIPVLSKGSIAFQMTKQKFTNLPPRHLLPGELSIYENFLLREKADGILINNLPVGIYPPSELINNYQVKAEYIEELDLYLVFDIDIPSTTIVDRYNMLRQAHPLTQNSTLEKINTMEEFIEIFNQERTVIKKFLNENREHSTKWYPKFACAHMKNSEIYKQLIEVILESDETLNSKLISEPYKTDGVIISPLDGSREIKIKPKSLMTIDLEYDGKRWIDRNKKDWSHIIKHSGASKKPGRIYRCYPDLSLNPIRFNVGEFRYDKKQSNPTNIVDNIINILNYDWLNDLESLDTFYYGVNKSINSVKLINTIKAQNELLEQKINEMEPSHNKNWLDLGCAKGKLVQVIKKFTPKFYMGLDVDIKQLVLALKIHDSNQNVYHFNPCDLADDWEQTKNKWFSSNLSVKYDYVVANFSLMHFFTEKFWEQLNNVVQTDTKFVFNLVNPSDKLTEWTESNSYMNIEENTVRYKFEWTHDEEKTEPLITDDNVIKAIEKYNWKLLSKSNTNSDLKLLNFYSWWIIQKC